MLLNQHAGTIAFKRDPPAGLIDATPGCEQEIRPRDWGPIPIGARNRRYLRMRSCGGTSGSYLWF